MQDLNNYIVIITLLLALAVLFRKKVRTSDQWRATVTPLASIIGSGFLVSAPLLILATGQWAVLSMWVIVLVAYCLGFCLRFNIRYFEPLLDKKSLSSSWGPRIEALSRPVLGVAYVISVAFYLKLLSAFALHGIGLDKPLYEDILTSSIIVFIGVMGKIRGLSFLEILATYSVNIKLAIIAALIVGHFFYNGELALKGLWGLRIYPHETWWTGTQKLLGMLIIIQGFETSRYLGYAHDANTRIKTMRYAQWISGGIYLLFVTLVMVVFNGVEQVSETSVIDLCKIVAPVLSVILVIAAVMSQFSAAVADTIGSGGLISEASQKKITERSSYLLIALGVLLLTWFANIYQIITIASKAFAVYYALEILIAIVTIKHVKQVKARAIKVIVMLAMFLLMLLVIVFGISVE